MTPDILRDKISAERADAFGRDHAAAADALRGSSRCLGAGLLRPDADPERSLPTIRRDSAEAHPQGFRQPLRSRDFLARIRRRLHDLIDRKHDRRTRVARMCPA